MFSIDLGHFIVRSINNGYNLKEMSSAQTVFKKWQPIMLLNCIYKNSL